MSETTSEQEQPPINNDPSATFKRAAVNLRRLASFIDTIWAGESADDVAAIRRDADILDNHPIAASESVQGGERTAGWTCKARASASDPPQDCDWPGCGCDPVADKVLEAIGEAGFEIVRANTLQEGSCQQPNPVQGGEQHELDSFERKPVTIADCRKLYPNATEFGQRIFQLLTLNGLPLTCIDTVLDGLSELSTTLGPLRSYEFGCAKRAHHLSAKRLLDEIMGDPADGDMTPEEAAAAYDAAPAIPIPAEEIDRIVQRVTQPTPVQQPGYRERLEALYSELGAVRTRIKERISLNKFPRKKHLVLSVFAAASDALFVAIEDFANDLDQTKGGG